jgi:hypothetical protein
MIARGAISTWRTSVSKVDGYSIDINNIEKLISPLKCSLGFFIVVSDLQFKLIDAFLHPDDLLLNSGLLSLENGHLLLKSNTLSLLVCIVTLDLLFYTVKFVL